ncbi:MAG: hypothetical protein QXS66_08745 [Thermoproteota archaeon]
MNNKGQMRVVEALLASGIIVIAMIMTISLTRAPNPYSAKSRVELEKYSYDFLMSLAEQEVFDKVIFKSENVRDDWEGLMKNVLNALLPPNILYNMTVYNMTEVRIEIGGTNTTIVVHKPLGTVSNASPDDFKFVEEAAGADITYTTRRRWVLKIHLELARR